MTVVGTRPEIIRLSEVIKRLDATPGVEHVLVHTGQNWDPLLNDVFFSDLGLRNPDEQLEIETTSLGSALGDVLRHTEKVIQQHQPDAFLVLGDTNSALALIMAKRMQVPTYHMEAGNRCFDENVPEETNRRIVDHAADFNLAYTEHARRNLLAEGREPRRILVTGSPMREVLDANRDRINNSRALEHSKVIAGQYFMVSAHRQENVDHPERLTELIGSLTMIAERWAMPVLVSTHPRTRRRMEDLPRTSTHPLVRFVDPFGFLDYCKLQMEATCVLSDSGTIAEEATMLGFNAVTLRPAIERPEALDTGAIIMTGVAPSTVLRGVEVAMARQGKPVLPTDYVVTNTSERVVNFILSTAPHAKSWSGLR